MAPTVEIKESTVLVILGASGDLAKKKLVNISALDMRTMLIIA